MRAVLVLCLAIAAVSALPRREDPTRIIGGDTVDISQYPFIVALLLSVTGTGTFTQNCGGTIINNRAVVTAAHCFDNYPWTWQWRHRVGSTWASNGGSEFATARIINHPNYNVAAWVDLDISVMHISGSFTFGNNIEAAGIAGPSYNLPDNQPVWAAGWGSLCTGCDTSDELMHVQLLSVNQATCRQRYNTGSGGITVTDNMLCSGWLDVGGRDICGGDSGGPLIHNTALVGVSSWGVCGSPQHPGVFVRVSRVTDWIVTTAELV